MLKHLIFKNYLFRSFASPIKYFTTNSKINKKSLVWLGIYYL